jgi:hypothetical protein
MDKKTEDKKAENGKNGQVQESGTGNGTGTQVPPIRQKKDGDGNVKQTPQKNGAKATPQKNGTKAVLKKKEKVVPSKQATPKKKQNRMLTEKDVREIKQLLKAGKMTQGEIAKKYDYEAGNISRIASGKLWKNVK